MAIEYYSSIDLNQNQLIRPAIHNSGAIANNAGVKGEMYINTSDNKMRYHDGTEWHIIATTDGSAIDSVTLTGGNGISLTNTNSSGGAYSSTITLDISDSSLTTATSIAQADLIAFSDESATNDPTKNISFTNFEDQIFANINTASSHVGVAAGGAVTIQSGVITSAMLAGSIAVTKLAANAITLSDGSQTSDLTLGDTLTITGTSPIGFAKESDDTFVITASNATTSAKGVAQFASADFDVNSGEVTIKNLGVSNAQLAGSITNAKLANDGITIGTADTSLGGTVTALVGLTDLDLTSGNKTIFDGVGSNTLTMGASGTTVVIPGNLTVTGDTIYSNDTIRIVADNTLEFEGASGTSATHELKLTTGVLSGDQTITLPDATGTVALTSQITGTNSNTNTGDVTLGGSLDYITISNQVITRNAIDLAADVTGTLPTANTAAKVTSIVAGDGIDVNNSGVGDVTVTAETASSSNPGIVELADATEIENGSGSGKVVDASQLGDRVVLATIAASSVNAATNKRAIINHSFNTHDIIVELYDVNSEATVHAEVTRTSDGSSTSADHITVDFGTNITYDVNVVIMTGKGGTAVTPSYA